MKSSVKLSVIVTSLNEEKNIKNCLLSLDAFLQLHLESYQIIHVDDGSTDRTFTIAHETKKEHCLHNLLILRLDTNQGIGAAIKFAMPKIQMQWFCWLPSDLEFLPSELLKPLSFCQDQDLVITYTSNAKDVRSHFRYYLSRAYTLIINFSFQRRIKYYNGITFYKKELSRHLKVTANRFFFHTELLLKILENNPKYIEVPLVLSPRTSGQSNAIKFKILKDVVICFLKNFWELKLNQKSRI